jgi:serine/threonine-protein kinase
MSSAPAQPRILFVDDEPRILLSLKAMFRGTYDVVTAEGGPAGIQQIRSQEFDVIVSDQRMPRVTGVEVLRTAREVQPRAIRLLLTGYSDLSAIIGSINEGEIFRFISKPWSNVELRAILAAAVEASKVEPLEASTGTEAAPGVSGVSDPNRVGVMLLDDDAPSRALLKRALEADYSIYEANSVKQCLDLLNVNPIGVIITELIVGGEMLTDLLVALHEQYPALVIVVLTAHADAGHSITLINKGQIYRLLVKPVSDSVLRGTVAIAGRRFEMLVHHPEQIRRTVGDKSLLNLPPEKVGLFARIKQALQSS